MSKYKIETYQGCTSDGVEVNGVSYYCEDERYRLTDEQKEEFHKDLFTEIKRMFDDGEIGVTNLIEMLHVEDVEYSDTCEQCGDTVITTKYEF